MTKMNNQRKFSKSKAMSIFVSIYVNICDDAFLLNLMPTSLISVYLISVDDLSMTASALECHNSCISILRQKCTYPSKSTLICIKLRILICISAVMPRLD